MMTLFTGDLEPPLEVTLAADAPVDVTSASSVLVIGKRLGATVAAISRPPSTTEIVGDTSVLTLDWVDGETDEQGYLKFEVEVKWPGNRTQTFRSVGLVQIRPDQGGVAP